MTQKPFPVAPLVFSHHDGNSLALWLCEILAAELKTHVEPFLSDLGESSVITWTGASGVAWFSWADFVAGEPKSTQFRICACRQDAAIDEHGIVICFSQDESVEIVKWLAEWILAKDAAMPPTPKGAKQNGP